MKCKKSASVTGIVMKNESGNRLFFVLVRPKFVSSFYAHHFTVNSLDSNIFI